MNIRLKTVTCTILGLLALSPVLWADAFPPAPALTAPPILFEAKVWLDAWDYDTVQTNENGFVTNWLSKADSAYNAKTYEPTQSAFALQLGKMGVTNGVPAFLMGASGSGIDLGFKKLSNIRTVFWVMDIIPGNHVNAQFLGCSTYGENDFYRCEDGIFNWYANAFPARFWLGDAYLFTWNDRRWNARNRVTAMTGLQVYALASDRDLRADRLSWQYNGTSDAGAKSGGRALSELIIFDRTLSNDEVLMVKSYLNAKYKTVAAVTINESVTPTAVLGYKDLTLGANASFVLTDAVLGGGKSAAVSVWGAFDKTAAGKIRLTYAGHVWNRQQALFQVAAGGLMLEDFELTDFPAKASLTCDGKTLWLSVDGSGDIKSSTILTDRTATGPRLWLDASKGDSFVTNATGGVLKWLDQSAYGNNATNYPYSGWTYPTVGVTNGVPALLLGKTGSSLDLAFNFMDDIRTVFWVMDIDQKSNYAYFLGTHTNATGGSAQAYQRSGNGRNGKAAFFHYTTPDQVMFGSLLEDGVVPPPDLAGDAGNLRWICPSAGRHVYSHRVRDDVPAWANNLGRGGNVSFMSGGKALSELVIFNRSLTDSEIANVTMQLRTKWRDAVSTTLVQETTLSEPLSAGQLVFDRASTAYNVETKASVVLTASALTAGRPAMMVYGEFRRGDITTLDIAWSGEAIAPGTYTILDCANLFNCTTDDFVFTGFPESARLFWEGTVLKARFLSTPTPLVPRVLSAAGETAPWLWLDASAAATLTTNEQGGVTKWADRGARGNDATAYQIGETQQYGTIGTTNGVTAYLMGATGSGIDLAFARTTTAQTMFWAMDIELRATDSGIYNDFLGDSEKLHFKRGGTGQYCATSSTEQRAFIGGTILEDGDTPHLKKSNPSWENWRIKPYPAGATHVYSLQANEGMSASYLSARLGSSTVATANCNGGRALSELVIFNRALTAAEFNDVEAYLDLKWLKKQVTLSTAVDVTTRVSYPQVVCEDGFAFTVRAGQLAVGGEAAVTIYGFCEKTGTGRITITNVGSRPRTGVVLFRCADSYGLSLESFDFVGFPEGTTFAWENSELKVTFVRKPGIVFIFK